MNLDDQLRDTLGEAFPPADTPPGLAESLIARAATAPTTSASGWSGTALMIGGAVLVGAVVGGLLGFFGGGDTTSGTTLGLDGVAVFACPGEGQTGTLHRGDRVLITGRTTDSAWLAVRNVRGASENVFVRADLVVEDEDTSDLPVRDCDNQGIVAIGSTTTSSIPERSTSTTVDETTTTTTGETTGTTAPPPPPPPPAPPPPPPPTATTIAPDTMPPTIANAAVSPENIWEEDLESLSCPPANPRQSNISAFVTDDTGVTQVTAQWTVPEVGTTTMTMTGAAGAYSTTFGPYPGETWPTVDPYVFDVTITVQARDAAGNTASTSVVLIVHSVWECFV